MRTKTFYKSLSDALWSRVNKKGENDCWNWLGSTNQHGHGHFGFKKIFYYAHRLSFKLHYGAIPKGMCVCHKCDNPKCVNPKHLFAGSHKDNTQDMLSKGRGPGLKPKDVIQIRNSDINKYNLKNAAKYYGVSESTIIKIISGKSKAYYNKNNFNINVKPIDFPPSPKYKLFAGKNIEYRDYLNMLYMVRDGYPLTNICKEYGCNLSFLSRLKNNKLNKSLNDYIAKTESIVKSYSDDMLPYRDIKKSASERRIMKLKYSGSDVIEARKNSGHSQGYAAFAMRISSTTLNHFEKGISTPSQMRTVEAINEYCEKWCEEQEK